MCNAFSNLLLWILIFFRSLWPFDQLVADGFTKANHNDHVLEKYPDSIGLLSLGFVPHPW